MWKGCKSIKTPIKIMAIDKFSQITLLKIFLNVQEQKSKTLIFPIISFMSEVFFGFSFFMHVVIKNKEGRKSSKKTVFEK